MDALERDLREAVGPDVSVERVDGSSLVETDAQRERTRQLDEWMRSDQTEPFPQDVLDHQEDLGSPAGTSMMGFFEHLMKLLSGEIQPTTQMGEWFVETFSGLFGGLSAGREIDEPEVETQTVEGQTQDAEDRGTETGTPDVATGTAQPATNIDEVLAAMVAGSTDREVISAFERESERLIREGMANGTIQQREGNAALRVINTDGVISDEKVGTGIRVFGREAQRSEFEIYQSIIDGAIRSGALNRENLASIGFDGHIDNTQELGVVMAEMARVREEAQETGRG